MTIIQNITSVLYEVSRLFMPPVTREQKRMLKALAEFQLMAEAGLIEYANRETGDM